MGGGPLAPGLIGSYARWRSSRLGEITDALERQLLVELAGPVAGKQVLDVGCGDGALATEFVRLGGAVTGLDRAPEMIAAARRRAAIASTPMQLVTGEVERLPFDDETFDLVTAVTVLCFVGDAAGAVAEMARVLRPGGRLLLGELGRWSLWAAHRRIRGWLGNQMWRTARFRSARSLRDLALAAGLGPVQIRGAVNYPPCAAAARLLAPVDPWWGRQTTLGSAFLALSARKPIREHREPRRSGALP